VGTGSLLVPKSGRRHESHGIGRPTDAHFHIPHGLSNAMLLPAVTAFSVKAAEKCYADCARAVDIANQMDSNQVATGKFIQGLLVRSQELQVSSPTWSLFSCCTNKNKGPPARRRPNWEGVLCQAYWAKALRVGRTPLDLGLSSCYDATRDAQSRQLPLIRSRPPGSWSF
jgi:hypothetical protein